MTFNIEKIIKKVNQELHKREMAEVPPAEAHDASIISEAPIIIEAICNKNEEKRRIQELRDEAKPPLVSSLASIGSLSVEKRIEAEVENKQAYAVNELVCFHDKSFINNCYKAILKRSPDNDGLNHYLDHLRRATMTKVQIIGRLKYSPEGRGTGVRVKGLLLRFVCDCVLRVPLIGYFLRIMTTIIQLPLIVRNMDEKISYAITKLDQQQEIRESEIEQIANYINWLKDNIVKDYHMVGEKLEKKHRLIESETLALVADKENELKHHIAENRNIIEMLKKHKLEADDFRTIIENTSRRLKESISEIKSSLTADRFALEQLKNEFYSFNDDLNGKIILCDQKITDFKMDLKSIKTNAARQDRKLSKQLNARVQNTSKLLKENINGIKTTLMTNRSEMEQVKNAFYAFSDDLNGKVILYDQKLNDYKEHLELLKANAAKQERALSEQLNACILENSRRLEDNIETIKTDLTTDRVEISQLKKEICILNDNLNDKIIFFDQTLKDYKAHLDIVDSHTVQQDREFAKQLDDLMLKTSNHVKDNINAIKTDLTADRFEIEQLREGLYTLNNDLNGKIIFCDLRLKDFKKRLDIVKTNAVVQDRKLSKLIETARERFPKPFDNKQIASFEQYNADRHDQMYNEFEDLFRGTPAEIKNRLKRYLSYIKKEDSVLDIGCGRGEFLSLLHDSQIHSVGVDRNAQFIERCRKNNLNVVHDDAIEYLSKTADKSFDVITAFHVIEHLPLKTLLQLFEEAIRVLKKGGRFIVETPNPENVSVGTHTFYLDPTHYRPLPKGLVQFIADNRGFCDIEILLLHPYEQERWITEDESEAAKRLNSYFYGPQDYAVIGYKVDE